MSRILTLVRHGPTAWNAEHRLQGRSDLPLSPEGRRAVAAWRLPPDLAGARWLASPLGRARETARLLGIASPQIEPALIEMSWGEWEGRRVADLRAELGAAFTAEEARGLDLQPPGGESPRRVQKRLIAWLSTLPPAGPPLAAVTHKGVIRALYAFATGWDMLGRPPERLRDATAHRFEVEPGAGVRLLRANIPLQGS